MKTAPGSATPTVRSNVTVPLAAPMSRGSALFMVMIMVLCLTNPMSIPATTVSAEARAVPVSVPSDSRIRTPTVNTGARKHGSAAAGCSDGR
ncbi:hypothetical protein [Streptomyces decoyicus]|uniref:hypothetical protein n=1 Tax=Streptomyces decoyicus TaxID=249567 RepID=UPI0038643E07